MQSGKGFSPVSGTFSTQGLNMDWVSSIQGIIEEQARQTEMKQITLQNNNLTCKSRKTIDHGMKNSHLCANIFAWSYRIFQGAGDAALENFWTTTT